MAFAEFVPPAFGWRPDIPDPRDLTPATIDDKEVASRIRKANKRARRRRHGSLISGFTPIVGPSAPRADSVQAVVDVVAYLERERTGSATPRSAEFLHRAATRLDGARGDEAVGIRTAIKAFVRFGLPPFTICTRDASGEPDLADPLLWGYQKEFVKTTYYRLDDIRDSGRTLQNVRTWLTAGIPCLFGFSVPTSLTRHPDIPFRPTIDGVRGGAAAVAVGYADDHRASIKGALLIRSVWGRDWGRRGYGWLPYAYVEEQLARDFWAVVTAAPARLNASIGNASRFSVR
jgi:hypothetical protein